jgi:anti-anti-sigma factor
MSVVSLPPEIDIVNARRIGNKLSAVARSGASVVIADMSLTTFCDCAGAHSILQAHHHAAAQHTELRLALPSPAVRRIFAILALDRLLPIYPTLDTALTGVIPNGAPSPAPATHHLRLPVAQHQR